MVKFDQNLTINCTPEFKIAIESFYKDKTVFQIGPGKGFFTRILKGVSLRITGIEIDPLFSEDLRKEGFQIINSDFKNWILEKENILTKLPDPELTLFSSLPYSQLKTLFTCSLYFEGYFIAPYYLQNKKGCFSNYLRYCYEIKQISIVPNNYFKPIPNISSYYYFIKRIRKISYSTFKNLFPNSLRLINKKFNLKKRLHELTINELALILNDYY